MLLQEQSLNAVCASFAVKVKEDVSIRMAISSFIKLKGEVGGTVST